MSNNFVNTASKKSRTGWWKEGFLPREIALDRQMHGGGRFGFMTGKIASPAPS